MLRDVTIPRLITFLSTHHSPATVNKKAKELVIGTVRLNSIPRSEKYHWLCLTLPKTTIKRFGLLTGLTNQQEEPDTPSQIYDQRNSILRVPEQVYDTEECSIDLAFDPAVRN